MSTTPARGPVADRLAPFGTTIFAEMTALAVRHGAVNLAQGFPDFDGPERGKSAAAAAIAAGHNQYARTFGVPALNQAIAAGFGAATGVNVDPDAHVTVTSGCTEAIAATLLGLLNPGDEVVMFEPFYDSYRACVAMAGGVPRVVTLRAPAESAAPDAPFEFDERELLAAIGPRTRVVLLNTPHNPTGKVFTRDELAVIAGVCCRHDLIAVCDEVYEHLTYDPGFAHVSMATLPGMWDRTVTLSSIGKAFSVTGWKVGWAIGPEPLTRAVRAAHQFLTFATATPLQHAAAALLRDGRAEVESLVAQLREARGLLAEELVGAGMRVLWPRGAYFILARIDGRAPSDVEFCARLTREVGVAAIPPSAFYAKGQEGRGLVRFAFCKRRETLLEAGRRLRAGLSRLSTRGSA